MRSELSIVKEEIKKICLDFSIEKKITLVVASKYFSIEQIKKLYDEGQRDFGENKVQDALEKIEALPKDIRWHFIGHLQKNKVNKILDLFTLIHSVDSLELAQKISERSIQTQSILLQINTSLEESKSGFKKEELLRDLDKIEALNKIEVKGLMTMAPHVEEEEKVRSSFKALCQIKEELNKKSWILSMGMSQDFPIALAEGADIIRIGRRLLPR